jgi:hypothetical protein
VTDEGHPAVVQVGNAGATGCGLAHHQLDEAVVGLTS